MRWTDDRLKAAIAVLCRHKRVDEACRELGVSPSGLKWALKNAGYDPPSAYTNTAIPPTAQGVRVLVIPDMHFPYHCPLMWATVLAAIRTLKPDVVVVIGDFIDCFEISDFAKPADRKLRFRDEIDLGSDALRTLEDVCEEAGVERRIFCMGNHEHRFQRYIDKRAPELDGLLSMESMLGLDETGWEVVQYGQDIQIGRIHFSHEFGPCGKYAAQKVLASMGHCAVFGHVHTGQVVYDGFTTGERHVAMAVGWGGDYEALAFSYKRKAAAKKEWIHGFGWCDIDGDGRGWCHFVPILDGIARVNGYEIRGEL